MDTALECLKANIDAPPRLRERLRPMIVASYRLEPPPPAAQLRLDGSVFEGFRDLAFLLAEGPAVFPSPGYARPPKLRFRPRVVYRGSGGHA